MCGTGGLCFPSVLPRGLEMPIRGARSEDGAAPGSADSSAAHKEELSGKVCVDATRKLWDSTRQASMDPRRGVARPRCRPLRCSFCFLATALDSDSVSSPRPSSAQWVRAHGFPLLLGARVLAGCCLAIVETTVPSETNQTHGLKYRMASLT